MEFECGVPISIIDELYYLDMEGGQMERESGFLPNIIDEL